MKRILCAAAGAMAAATMQAGTINWIIEGTFDPNFIVFLVQTHNDDYTRTGTYNTDVYQNTLQFYSGGTQLMEWDDTNKKLIFNGGTIVACVTGADISSAPTGTFTYSNQNKGAGYYVSNGTAVPGYTAVNLRYISIGSLGNAAAPDYMQFVHNPNEYIHIDNIQKGVDQWTASQAYYKMVIFNPEKGQYTYVDPLQYDYDWNQNGVMSNGKVMWSDVHEAGRSGQAQGSNLGNSKDDGHKGGYYLDPIFPAGDPEWANLWDHKNSTVGWDGTLLPISGQYTGLIPVPEPSTVTLALLGVAMFGLRRKVRRG